MPNGCALLLQNPESGAGDPVDEAASRLRGAGIRVIDEALGAPADAGSAIDRHRDAIDRVVVAGGDGTLNGAAPAVIAAGLPLGILPSGTANDLAHTLGIPLDPLAAADVIAAGRTRTIDVGDVNGRPFFNVASIGLSADVAATLDAGLKRRFGRLSYAIAALRVLLGGQPFHATIGSGDARARVRSFQIAVGNGRFYGAGCAVDALARIDDGRLDLYSLEPASMWKLLFMVRDFRRGLHGAWREVRTAQDIEFIVETRTPRPVNADGELVAQTPARFTVRPRAIAVFAP